jgi:hypothetical protein
MPADWEVAEETPAEDTSHVLIPRVAPGQRNTQPAYKNNNPGNVEYVGQPGASKSEDGRFAKFDTPEAGLADIHRIIGLHQNDTLEKYISTYAPANENDTATYVANAAKELGVPASTIVSKIDRDKLAAFQAKQESSSKVSRGDDWAVAKEQPEPSDWNVSKEEPEAAAPSIIDRAKALLDQARGIGSQVADRATQPGLGFARRGTGEEIVKPWQDAAKSLVEEATGPLKEVPGGSYLRDFLISSVDKGGEAAAGALEFLTSPLGVGTAPLAAGEGLLSGAVRSAYAGSQAPQAVQDVATAVGNPTAENVAGAAVSAAGAASPMAPELAAGVGRGVEAGKNAAGALERHNVEAARLVEAERQAGMGTEAGKEAIGGEQMPVKVGDRTLIVKAAGGQENTARPFYQVLDENGKALYGGFGQQVQEYLRLQGAEPTGGAAPPLRSDFAIQGRDYYVRETAPGKLDVVDSETGKVKFTGNQNKLADFITSSRAVPTREFEPGTPAATVQTERAPKATIPEEGAPENVERTMDARERLAQDMAGKSWKDLSNPERLVVDEFVSQGYGFAVQHPSPVESTTPPTSPTVEPTVANETLAQAPTPARTASLAYIETQPEQFNRATELNSVATPPISSRPIEGPQAADSEGTKTTANSVAAISSRAPSVEPAYGREVQIAVPGEKTSYPARYAIREASDVQPSHNPQSFEPNPAYQHQNDRDYSQVENAARVVNAAQDFRPEFVLTESPTAEHGPTIIDANGNALGGNNRAMALARAYQSANPQAAEDYKTELKAAAPRFGIDPATLDRFSQPVLVREIAGPLSPTRAANAITDFNKTSAAALNPGEQAVSDGRRLSKAALTAITERLDDLGDEGTLAQALRGEDGAVILARLVKDGLITEQEKNGYLDERGFLTPDVKDRIAKAIVGRLFASPKEMQQTPPELRAKVEKIAPQVLRVEDRKGWELTEPVKEALAALLTEARARGTKNLEDLTQQTAIGGTREYSPASIQIAKVMKEGPLAAAKAFRMYANDEAMSRPGAQTTLYEPPTQREAFDAAFGVAEGAKRTVPREGERGSFSNKPKATKPQDLGSLFGEETEREVDEQTRLDRAKLQGQQLTAQLNAPISREEQLRRLRRAKAAPQTGFFEETPEEPQGDLFGNERGAVSPGLLTLGLDKFVAEDIAPTVREAAHTVAQASDDILKILLPSARGESAKRAALIMRNRLAELARSYDRAEASLATARKFFEKAGDKGGRDFILKYFADENAALPQTGDKELDGIAKVLRNLLDGRREEVQALGKGKLKGYYTNYFPRIWKDWRKAESIFQSYFGRRPLEGGKSFLKQRKYPTIEDALNAGLEPVSWNPIDLVLLKIREMDRYLMAHRVLDDWKSGGLTRFVDAREGKAPTGWTKIADPIGTVYGPSIQDITEYPNAGLWEGLTKVADALGVTHERGFKSLHGGRAIGLAHQGTGKVQTLHGTAEDVLAHEIGHQIDWLAGSGHRFVLNYPSVESVARIREARRTLAESGSSKEARAAARKTLKDMKPDIAQRKEFNRQLRALADLRSGRKEYTHKREEKMALLAEMWVGARELFQETAPLVFKEWKQFLAETPKLEALHKIQGNTEVNPIAQPYDVGGLVIRGHWWAPEGAARIMNNYLSPSLRTTSGAYRAVLGLNNVLNQFQLGLSAFHLGMTSLDAAASRASVGYEALLRGKPIVAARMFAGVPAAPVANLISGNKVLREWYRPGSEGGAIAKIVEGLVAAGGRARMDEIYGTKIGDKMAHAFRNGNVWGGLIRAPFAGIEAVSNVMMREIVPRQKLGVFADMARFEMERLGPDATFEETRAALAKAWDSVENRMGQMTYDNLFWNRTAKDLAMLGVRSVGWNLGTLRELGGGAVDAIRIPIQIAGGKPPKDVNLKRISYWMGLVTVSAIMGALYQYLRTGKGPDELKDYFFPKTGQLDEAGRPQRVALPSYIKDVYHYATEPGKTLANKVAPIWSVFAEMVRNEDFYGTEIRGSDDPLVEQMKQLAEYVGGAVEPFGVRNYQRDVQMQNPAADKAQRFVGIVPAPAAIEKTKAERLASELSRERIPVGGRTHGEAARRDAEQTIARLAKAGKDYATQARDYVQSGVLTAKDAHAAALRSQVPPLLRTARSLPLEDLLKVWNVATPEERDELRSILRRHLSSVKDLPLAQRTTVVPKLQEALSQ